MTRGFVALSEVRYPPRCRAGDRVALLSPSAGLPAIFPHVHELGMQRLRDEYALVPVEYATTRVMGAPPAERARDIIEAFTDDSVTAVLATIGGDDQITVLKHLDREVLAANPKRFFGFSDNTNLLNLLVNVGMVAFHGGSTMVHFGRSGAMHPATAASLRGALLDGGRFELTPPAHYSHNPRSWDDPTNLVLEPDTRPASPWSWHGAEIVVNARVWGGCLEILDWTMQVGNEVADADHYRGSVLFIETSEEMPPAAYVYRTLRNLGERGILGALAALLVARPNAEPLGTVAAPADVAQYEAGQRDAVLRAVGEYHPTLPCVIGIDAGHTDPQFVIPLGGNVVVDAMQRRLFVDY